MAAGMNTVSPPSHRGYIRPLLLICLSLSLLSCRQEPSDSQPSAPPSPRPPDLSTCTRIEIRYLPSLLEYGFHGRQRKGVLSPEELAHIRSCDPFVVDQQEHINVFAQSIGLGCYCDTRYSVPGVATVADVTCYRGEQRVASFKIKQGLYTVVGANTWFQYTGEQLDFLRTMTDLWPLVLRANCADNLGGLRASWSPRVGRAPKRPSEDEWNVWCDVTLHREILRSPSMGASRAEAEYATAFMRYFRCPSAGAGKCHYAANPNCRLDSPADMVFLFETKAAWNQHGGPELFSFDNHEPKGGCVLLNDGTVTFIRTEEELMQLRWK
jgi:hypothetical protein